jgi:hypothetical protein
VPQLACVALPSPFSTPAYLIFLSSGIEQDCVQAPRSIEYIG